MNWGVCANPNCGKSLRGRKADTVYCSGACRSAASRARRAAASAAPVPAGDDVSIGDLAGQVRRMLGMLASRTQLTPGEARWCEQSRRVLADGPLLERLERAEITLTRAQVALMHAVITACLADHGVDASDPEVGARVAGRIREIAAAGDDSA